jgi:hypothetical protein
MTTLAKRNPTPIRAKSLRVVIAFIDNEIARLEQSMRRSGDSFDRGDPWPEQTCSTVPRVAAGGERQR